jgi:DNA-binding transcriptional LysR family regulator
MGPVELTIRHLAVLCAIEDQGSIGKAAAKLAISQPALTAQLHRIERELGQDVFQRGQNGVTVTLSGRRVLTHARAALAAVDRLRQESRSLEAGSAVIRIGGHGPLLVAAVERLAHVVTTGMHITVRAEQSSRRLQAELEQGKLDFVVLREMPGHEIPHSADVEERVLVDHEPLFLGLSRNHRLADRDAVDVQDLRLENWVIDPDDDTGESESLRDACRAAGFELRIGLITADNGVTRSYIGHGHVIGLFEARAEQDHEFVVRPLLGDPIWCRLVLRWRSDTQQGVSTDTVATAVTAAYDEISSRHRVYSAWRNRSDPATAAFSSSTRSTRSQVNSGNSRPKWP